MKSDKSLKVIILDPKQPDKARKKALNELISNVKARVVKARAWLEAT